MKLNFGRGFTNETISIMAYATITIAPISFGVYLVSIKNITLGTLIMISQLSNNFVNPVITISAYFNDLKVSKPMWEKFQDLEKGNNNFFKNNSSKSYDLESLELKNVTVEQGGKIIFKDVSFNIKKGDKVLIIAPSGWGKTTLLNTLLGNIDIKNGDYLVNNKSVIHNLKIVHNYFSYINQEPKILDDTILYNITLGYSVSKNRLDDIINKAGLLDLIKEKGLDFKFGKEGSNLSGGQKQRIEIARALFLNRSAVLADEVTASLDLLLSKIIHDTLKKYNGTIIEVAHHLTSEEKKIFNKIIDFKNY